MTDLLAVGMDLGPLLLCAVWEQKERVLTHLLQVNTASIRVTIFPFPYFSLSNLTFISKVLFVIHF